jgi:hypothetical protein
MATANRDQADTLSVAEMLRIMDVATALRQDRQLIEEQLNIDQVKALLREKMIAAAKVTGEEVSPEEVDAAIDRYYGRLYTFKEPANSLSMMLARLYVRRLEIAKWGGLALGLALLSWWLFLSPSGLMTVTGRTHQRVERLAAEVARREAAIRALARDPSVNAEVTRLAVEAQTYRRQDDPQKLETVRAALAALESRLGDEYTVTVASPVGGRSAVQRLFRDRDGQRVSGYYLIVQAKRPDGTVLTRRVHDDEADKDKDVTTWAERVPKEVFDRLAKDKRDDGILNETTFAVKKRGEPDEVITMPGPDGQPLRRQGQITEWER